MTYGKLDYFLLGRCSSYGRPRAFFRNPKRCIAGEYKRPLEQKILAADNLGGQAAFESFAGKAGIWPLQAGYRCPRLVATRRYDDDIHIESYKPAPFLFADN